MGILPQLWRKNGLEGGIRVINLEFSSVSELRGWLEKKNYEAESGEAYDEWLRNFFDTGNSVAVRGEEYDYWACWELI